jgi:hypothetical protein
LMIVMSQNPSMASAFGTASDPLGASDD